MNKISIIVPTFREADNIPELTSRIDSSLKNTQYTYEIIIVDDNSQDGIDRKVDELQKKYPETIIRLYDIYSDFEVLTKDTDAYNKKYNINLTNLNESCWPGWYTRKPVTHDALVTDIKKHIGRSWRSTTTTRRL